MTSANTFSELEEMLKAFRCQDLANLLAFAGQTKNGKKSELYDRCINILKKGNPNIQFKLKDIYNSICSKTNTTAPNYNNNLISNLNSNSNSGSSSPDPSMINRYNAPPSVYANSFNQFGHNANNNSVTNGSFQPVHVGVATRSNGFQATTNSLKVQFEKLAFFYLLHELQSPNKMTIMNPNHRPYSYYFQFFMNLDQANEITGAREMIGGKLEYSKQIHLRFGYFESNLQADNLPANLTVNVNGRPASLPAPKPTSKPNADIIRPGRSIDVTHLCKLVPNLPNKVDIQWTNSDPSKQYCVGVYVFKKVSVASLIQHLKQNCVKEAEQTRKMVREKLQITDSDFLIETETLKVNLSCPLMKTRLQLPGRSFKCKHVQCFELESYLMMNEKKPTWNCPVCDQNAPFDDLIIDGLNQEILSKCTDVDEVEFLADGTWKKVNENDKCVAKKSKQEETKKSKINNDDDVEICDISLSPPTMKRNDSNTEIVQSQKQANLNLSNEDQNNKKKDDDCIDLTADSDEEMPLQQNLASIAASLNKVSSASSSSSSNPNELVTTTSVNSISRSSSNNSSIYNQQHGSTEAQVSSDSNQFNDDLSNFRNKSITNNININNNNNKKKEMSPNQSIISLSSNSSLNEDPDRSCSLTPTNLEQLNKNATSIITNIDKLFQNDKAISNNIRSTSNSSSSTNTILSTPMDMMGLSIPSMDILTGSGGSSGKTTPTNNPVLSNSQLARGLSAPSPTRPEYNTSLNSNNNNTNNNLRQNSSASSLTSIPNIIENVNVNNIRNNNLSPISTTSSQNPNNRVYSPNSKLINNNQLTPKKLINDNNSMTSRHLEENNLQQHQYQQQMPYLQQQQQQQRVNGSGSSSSGGASTSKPTMPQRPNEHSLINSNNRIGNISKYPLKRVDLSKDKARMVTDELKAMQSNPNMNMVDQNYKNRIIQQNVPISINNNNNPQLVNKNRPVQTLQSSFINKMPNNNNPFDSDQIIKNTQHQQQQQQQQVQKPNIPPTKPILASNAQQKQSQPHLIPHQQQQQRPITQMGVNTTNNFDHVNRQLPQNLSSTEQAMLLKQQQRNQQFNANVVNSLKNINQVNNKPMTSSQSSQIQTMKSMQSSQTAAAAVAGVQTTTSNPNLKPTNKNNLISPTNPNNLNPNNNNNNKQGFNQFNNTNRPNNISPQRQQQPNHTTVNMHPNYQLSNFQKSVSPARVLTGSGNLAINQQHNIQQSSNRINQFQSSGEPFFSAAVPPLQQQPHHIQLHHQQQQQQQQIRHQQQQHHQHHQQQQH